MGEGSVVAVGVGAEGAVAGGTRVGVEEGEDLEMNDPAHPIANVAARQKIATRIMQ